MFAIANSNASIASKNIPIFAPKFCNYATSCM